MKGFFTITSTILRFNTNIMQYYSNNVIKKYICTSLPEISNPHDRVLYCYNILPFFSSQFFSNYVISTLTWMALWHTCFSANKSYHISFCLILISLDLWCTLFRAKGKWYIYICICLISLCSIYWNSKHYVGI